MLKKIVLVLSVLAAAATAHAQADLPEKEDVKVSVTLNGKYTELEPFAKDGEVYIPLRSFLADTDTEIIWDNYSVTLKKEYPNTDGGGLSASAKFSIGSNECITAAKAENTFKLESAPLLVNEKTYIPHELARLLDREISLTNGFELTINSDDVQNERLKKALVWAEALKTRDGKPRYDMMTDELKKEFEENQKQLAGDDWNFVIGYSSPRTTSYDIVVDGDNAYITYYQEDNTGARYSVDEKIVFTEDNLVSDSE